MSNLEVLKSSICCEKMIESLKHDGDVFIAGPGFFKIAIKSKSRERFFDIDFCPFCGKPLTTEGELTQVIIDTQLQMDILDNLKKQINKLTGFEDSKKNTEIPGDNLSNLTISNDIITQYMGKKVVYWDNDQYRVIKVNNFRVAYRGLQLVEGTIEESTIPGDVVGDTVEVLLSWIQNYSLIKLFFRQLRVSVKPKRNKENINQVKQS